MNKRVALIAAILSLTMILSPLQAAAPKAGSKCIKIGATTIFAGKKYTCIKSGKKLVWNKGITIKAAPIPTPTESSRPTTTPETSNMPKPEVITSPSPTPTLTAAETRTPEGIQNLSILEKSWAQINDLQPKQDSGRIVFLIDPNFPIQSRDAIKKGINLTVAKFDNLFKIKKPIYAIFSTSLEFELAQFQKYSLMQQNYEAEVRSNPVLLQWRKDHYKAIESGQKDFASGGTMPLYNGPMEPAGYYMYFRLHPENQDSKTVLLGAHETGHLLQWQMNWDFPETIPAWWIEGQAQMIGENVASQANDFSEYEKFLKSQNTPNYGGGFFSGTVNLRDLEGDPLTRTQFNCSLCGTRLIYSRGKVAINYLAGKYGNEKVITFMSTLSRSNRWWESFEKTFGISVENFYAEYTTFAKWFGDYFSPSWEKSQF